MPFTCRGASPLNRLLKSNVPPGQARDRQALAPGGCPRTPPPSGVPWPHPCTELLTAAWPGQFPGLLLPASPRGGPASPRHPRTTPMRPGRSPPARLKLPDLSAAFSGHVPQPFPAREPSKQFCWAKPHPFNVRVPVFASLPFSKQTRKKMSLYLGPMQNPGLGDALFHSPAPRALLPS